MFQQSREIRFKLTGGREMDRQGTRFGEGQHFCLRLISSIGHVANDEKNRDQQENQTDRDERNHGSP